MITPAFIFTVFMVTLGPIKTVPAFFSMTQSLAPSAARSLALKGTAAAIAISLLIALVMTGWPRLGGSRATICGSQEAFCCSPPRAR